MNSYANDDESLVLEQEALKVAKRYNFSEASTVSFLSKSENRVYVVNDPSQRDKFVIRINSGRVKYHTPVSIQSELVWMAAIRRDTDVIVPSVLNAMDGSLVQTIDGLSLDRPRYAVAYSFVPGTQPSEDALASGFEQLGEISAQLHHHAKNWRPPASFMRHSLTPDAILDDQLNWGRWQLGVRLDPSSLQLLARLETVIRKRLALLSRDRERFGLIHADLRLANLLVENDRIAIIDFDDCGYGWYLFDLAAALSFLEERADVPELIASWIIGYRRIAQPPDDVIAEISTLIMLRRLQLLGWVAYQQQHLDFARAISQRFTSDTCRLADEYLVDFA